MNSETCAAQELAAAAHYIASANLDCFHTIASFSLEYREALEAVITFYFDARNKQVWAAACAAEARRLYEKEYPNP